jgi:hypothetical protein
MEENLQIIAIFFRFSREFTNTWLNKVRDLYISIKFESNKKKIKLQQFSSNFHENSLMLGSINLEIYISL